ncbi:MAG TPA: Ni/Fe hydrogenase subunit alpha, partial [Thermodesulfovibrionales bacterium]|nr:Ni/Fe hydrogenase subunit alpha [Thermodesulfovibrionales bacterium]
VEAPRGTLIHHYKSDERGLLTEVNLIVATVNNAAAICMSVDKAAKSLIKKGEVSDSVLNMVEMAFRAYDPCFACATHLIGDNASLPVYVYDAKGDIMKASGDR